MRFLIFIGAPFLAAASSCSVNEKNGVLLADGEAGCCKLTQEVPEKPFPSLTQCYKYNTQEGACCKSGHDAKIKEEYEGLLSSTCLREFTHLEFYFCLGCNAKQWKFVDESTKTLKVCKSFAEMLFSKPDDASDEADRYERCGLNMKVKNNNNTRAWEPGKYQKADEPQVIMPFSVFTNATQFLNELRPPYFEDYTIVITSGDDDCFSAASSATLLPSVLLVVLALHTITPQWFSFFN